MTRLFAYAAIAALGLAAAGTVVLTPSTPALAQAAQPAAQDDTITTTSGDLIIHPIHHAAVMLTFGGKHIYVDPAPPQPTPQGVDVTAEYKAMPPADVIFITHEHGDHFNVPILTAMTGANTQLIVTQTVFGMLPDALKAKAKVMKNGDSMDVAGIPVEAVPAYNTTADRLTYHPKGDGNGYILTMGGKRIYFAGDTEETPELKNLPNIDVAFIPINLPYTETIEAATAWVKDFKPKIVYPYHYSGTDVTPFKTMVGTVADVRLRKWY